MERKPILAAIVVATALALGSGASSWAHEPSLTADEQCGAQGEQTAEQTDDATCGADDKDQAGEQGEKKTDQAGADEQGEKQTGQQGDQQAGDMQGAQTGTDEQGDKQAGQQGDQEGDHQDDDGN